MSTREKGPEKDIQTSTHGEESVGKEPRTREEENQSVREALRRIVPELIQRNILEKQPCPEPGQDENDIFEKLLYEFRLAQQIYAMRREKWAWFEEQEEQEKSLCLRTPWSLPRGDIDAQKRLCEFYQKGFGTQASPSSAFQWALTTAKSGDEEAQRKVGTFFYNGYGTEKNEGSAFYWFMRAAEQGSSMAQKRIGDYYSRGVGVPQSSEAAFTWYLKAAENGDRSAKYLVGLCYYEGTGIPQDLSLAFQWMKADAPEHGSARKFLKNHQKEFLQFGGEES